MTRNTRRTPQSPPTRKKVIYKEISPLGLEALAWFEKVIITAQLLQEEFSCRDGKKTITGEKTERIVQFAIKKFKENLITPSRSRYSTIRPGTTGICPPLAPQ